LSYFSARSHFEVKAKRNDMDLSTNTQVEGSTSNLTFTNHVPKQTQARQGKRRKV
jgi:hypothetical protein